LCGAQFYMNKWMDFHFGELDLKTGLLIFDLLPVSYFINDDGGKNTPVFTLIKP